MDILGFHLNGYEDFIESIYYLTQISTTPSRVLPATTRSFLKTNPWVVQRLHPGYVTRPPKALFQVKYIKACGLIREARLDLNAHGLPSNRDVKLD